MRRKAFKIEETREEARERRYREWLAQKSQEHQGRSAGRMKIDLRADEDVGRAIEKSAGSSNTGFPLPLKDGPTAGCYRR
jgi:hypothetical protein